MIRLKFHLAIFFGALISHGMTPIDLIPEALFGVLGLGDNLFAMVRALLYGVNLYREYVVRIGEVQR